MEEEDDDFYGGRHEGASAAEDTAVDVIDEKMEMSDDQDEEEEDDSDDDVQFTLEKPTGASSEPASGTRSRNKQHDRTVSTEPPKPPKSNTPLKQESQRPSSTAPPTAAKGALTHDGKEGKDFPEIRTSKVDVNGTPTWSESGKLITEVDVDADLAEHSKPWRLPGTDQTDFFNYGFDEYTWTQYCVRQQTMSGTISDQKQADAQMKALFGGGAGGGGGGGGNGGGGGGGGGPAGMPGMPPGMAMPDPDQMMQMVNQGIIPPEFAQMMQMGGMPGMPGPGPNSVSPGPQGQGFQPPTGPGGGGMQGQQGGFSQGTMDGYSPQQMTIMQQEQQGPMQGGGGRGRGRRGRGGYY